jgi:hypothetical protein
MDSHDDRTLIRRRHAARLYLLKRRITAVSVLGFAAMFGLAAQHVVRGASAGNAQGASPVRSSTPAAAKTYFDQQGDGFSFDDSGTALPPNALPPAAPVAQTSVS